MTGSDLTNQEKLEEVYEMTTENNKILRSIRTQQHIANAFRLLYWVVIIVSLGGAYLYVRPLVSAFTGNSSGMDQTIKQLNELRAQIPEARFFDKMIHRAETTDESTSTAGQ